MSWTIPSTWQQWLKGIAAAFIGSFASAFGVVVAGGSVLLALKSCVWAGAFSVAAYLKTSPLPPASTTLIATKQVTVTGGTQEQTDAVAASIASQPMSPQEKKK